MRVRPAVERPPASFETLSDFEHKVERPKPAVDLDSSVPISQRSGPNFSRTLSHSRLPHYDRYEARLAGPGAHRVLPHRPPAATSELSIYYPRGALTSGDGGPYRSRPPGRGRNSRSSPQPPQTSVDAGFVTSVSFAHHALVRSPPARPVGGERVRRTSPR